MAALLSKFRIDFAGVTMLPHAVAKPSQDETNEFEKLIKLRRTEEDVTDGKIYWIINIELYSTGSSFMLKYHFYF